MDLTKNGTSRLQGTQTNQHQVCNKSACHTVANLRGIQCAVVLAPPLDTGEPPEITVPSTNIGHITDAVTARGSLQRFADFLVENTFITPEVASGIRDKHLAEKASMRLIDTKM